MRVLPACASLMTPAWQRCTLLSPPLWHACPADVSRHHRKIAGSECANVHPDTTSLIPAYVQPLAACQTPESTEVVGAGRCDGFWAQLCRALSGCSSRMRVAIPS